jgi:hypothetical protein
MNPQDKVTTWRKFTDGLRRLVGLRSIELANRFAEAKVRQEEANATDKEADAFVKIKIAEAQYIEAMARAQQIRAEADKLQIENRMTEHKLRFEEAMQNPQVQKLILAKDRSPEELQEELGNIMTQIRVAGGNVEFDLPETSSEQDSFHYS